MKIYVLDNNVQINNELTDKLSKVYNIKKHNVEKIEEVNKIIRENKEWIITSTYNDISNVIANSSTSIIYLYKKEDNINDFIKKYSNKIIILKTKKEIKKLFNAIYEGIEL